jgi:glycerophosphoryl diester phosphodiesterase
VASLSPVSIHCDQAVLQEDEAKTILAHYPLYCYTVNDTVTLEKLLHWGIRGIFSDRAHAQELKDVIERFKS